MDKILDCQVTPFAISEREASAHRALFITEKGALALVPPLTREGDQVCILLGAQTPFILCRCIGGEMEGGAMRTSQRRSGRPGIKKCYDSDLLEARVVEVVWDEVFDLVGESFVHGLMDGEALAFVGSDFHTRGWWD